MGEHDGESVPTRDASCCPHKRSRIGVEGRVAFGDPDEGEDAEGEFIATPTRQFSLLEITSGLPDDSREADERAAV